MVLSPSPSSTVAQFSVFFFYDTATTEIYTLSLHDALPISLPDHTSARYPVLKRFCLLFCQKIDVGEDRKSTRLNSSHVAISYAVFCLKKKKRTHRWPGTRHDNSIGP